ncbi:MAG: hypothetical protein H0V82_10515 [Candidatus Protochlamydia sp.]|nr:hypothetical protein [Candidatus Protochlamydia sp.]
MFPLSNNFSEYQNQIPTGYDQSQPNSQGCKRTLHFGKYIESSDIFNHSDINKLILSISNKSELVKMSLVSKNFRKIIKDEFVRRLNYGVTFEQLRGENRPIEISMIVDFFGCECIQLTKLHLHTKFSKIDDGDIELISQKFKNLAYLSIGGDLDLTNASINAFKILTSLKSLKLGNGFYGNDGPTDLSFIESYVNLEILEIKEFNANFHFLKKCTKLKSLTIKNKELLMAKFPNSNNKNIFRLNECCPSLRKLTLKNFTNKNLSFLNGSSNLESLTISNFPELINTDSLLSCTSLKELIFYYCNHENFNFSKLEKWPLLEKIFLYYCYPLVDTTFIEACSQTLKSLTLSGLTSTPNMQIIAQCKNLIKLDLTSCNIKDITDLRECTHLEFLSLSFNRDPIEINSLYQLRALRKLFLVCTDIQDISALRFCPTLEELDLQGSMGIIDISALQYCNSLKIIRISSYYGERNFMNEQNIALIKTYLNPKIEIILEGPIYGVVAFTMNEPRCMSDIIARKITS